MTTSNSAEWLWHDGATKILCLLCICQITCCRGGICSAKLQVSFDTRKPEGKYRHLCDGLAFWAAEKYSESSTIEDQFYNFAVRSVPADGLSRSYIDSLTMMWGQCTGVRTYGKTHCRCLDYHLDFVLELHFRELWTMEMKYFSPFSRFESRSDYIFMTFLVITRLHLSLGEFSRIMGTQVI